MNVEPLNPGEKQILLVKRIGPDDLPIMLKEINAEEMKRYFLGKASELVKAFRT